MSTTEDEIRSKVAEIIKQVAWMWEPTARDLPESCIKDVDYIMSLLNTERNKARIDELRRLHDVYYENPNSDVNFLEQRVKALEASLKENI
jgi:hypothetical protein